MAAEGGQNIVWLTYTGREEIPRDATHIFVDAKVIPPYAFAEHRNIVEVICHKRVKKIDEGAFAKCRSLRRIIMPGVEIVEGSALEDCRALTDVECGKLEIIKEWAFCDCKSLEKINLQSARIIQGAAFIGCDALADVKFSIKLERIEESAFLNCFSLERITIPLKAGIITARDIFQACKQLKHVDLVEGAVLQETVAALQLEYWRKDMNEEIDSINQILPNACPGYYDDEDYGDDDGEKARAIRRWIRSVIGKINHFKAEHQHILDEAATTLQCTLPHEIVTNNVLAFLELPAQTFERANQEMEEDHIDEEEDDADV